MTADRPATLEHSALGIMRWDDGSVAYRGDVIVGHQLATFNVLVDPPAWTAPIDLTGSVELKRPLVWRTLRRAVPRPAS